VTQPITRAGDELRHLALFGAIRGCLRRQWVTRPKLSLVDKSAACL
jgi:hypothetical protein